LLKKQTALMELIANTAEIISMRACVNVHTAAKLIDVSVACLMRQLADEITVFFPDLYDHKAIKGGKCKPHCLVGWSKELR